MYSVRTSDGILKFKISDKTASLLMSRGAGEFMEKDLTIVGKVLTYVLIGGYVLDVDQYGSAYAQLLFYKGDYLYKDK